MSFKYISNLSLGGHFVQRSITACVILVEGLMWNISMELF